MKIRITSDVEALKRICISDEEAGRLAGNVVETYRRNRFKTTA